jgi:hypothetical protein
MSEGNVDTREFYDELDEIERQAWDRAFELRKMYPDGATATDKKLQALECRARFVAEST